MNWTLNNHKPKIIIVPKVIMKNIIHIEKEEMFVSLDTIVKYTANDEESVKRLVRKNKEDLIELGLSYGEGRISNPEDLNYTELRFNEDVATYLITLMANSKVVKKFKFELVVNFREARKTIRDSICTINRLELAKKDAQIKRIKSEKKLCLLSEDGYSSCRGVAQRSEFTERQVRDFAEKTGLIESEVKASLSWNAVGSELVVRDDVNGTPYYNLKAMSSLLDQYHNPEKFEER